MKKYKALKAIEISTVGKSDSFIQLGSVLEEANNYVQVDLIRGSLTEVIVLHNANVEKFCLTRSIVESLVQVGALEVNE
jgi:hypothetical protein